MFFCVDVFAQLIFLFVKDFFLFNVQIVHKFRDEDPDPLIFGLQNPDPLLFHRIRIRILPVTTDI